MADIHNDYSGATITFQAGSTQNGDITITDCTIHQHTQPSEAPSEPADLVARLLPIFMDDEILAREYLKAVNGKAPTEITRITNRWVKEKRIDAKMKNRPLWEILHDANIYPNQISTWNKQIIG